MTKKKTPGILGVTAWYQSIGIQIPRADRYGSRSLDSLSSGVAVCTSEHRYVIAKRLTGMGLDHALLCVMCFMLNMLCDMCEHYTW